MWILILDAQLCMRFTCIKLTMAMMLVHFTAIIIFAVSGLVMVVVSFFTKKVPLDELGGLTWSTIGNPPISHGAIGEVDIDEVKAENGTVHHEAIELLEKKGKII